MFCTLNPSAYVSKTPRSSFSAPRAPLYVTPAVIPCIVVVSYPPVYTYTAVPAGRPLLRTRQRLAVMPHRRRRPAPRVLNFERVSVRVLVARKRTRRPTPPLIPPPLKFRHQRAAHRIPPRNPRPHRTPSRIRH